MPLSPKKKAKADAERREREKYPPGTSARLPLPYKPSPEVAKWLTTEKKHWAEDAVAEALAREPVKSIFCFCLFFVLVIQPLTFHGNRLKR